MTDKRIQDVIIGVVGMLGGLGLFMVILDGPADAQTPAPRYPAVVQSTGRVELPGDTAEEHRYVQRITVDGVPCVLYDTEWNSSWDDSGQTMSGAISCDWGDR